MRGLDIRRDLRGEMHAWIIEELKTKQVFTVSKFLNSMGLFQFSSSNETLRNHSFRFRLHTLSLLLKGNTKTWDQNVTASPGSVPPVYPAGAGLRLNMNPTAATEFQPLTGLTFFLHNHCNVWCGSAHRTSDHLDPMVWSYNSSYSTRAICKFLILSMLRLSQLSSGFRFIAIICTNLG